MLRPSRAKKSDERIHPTRQRLVEEAARQIVTGGVEAVDVDLVLANVGVTKGSMYHHFTSVNDLIIAGLLRAFEDGIRESEVWSLSLRNESRSAREARDRLRSIVGTSQVAERRMLRSIRLQALSMARTQPELAEGIARLQADLTDMITEVNQEFQRRGWTRPELDPRALAVLIQAMNLGRIVDDVVPESHRVDPDGWIALYNDVLDATFIIDDE